MGAHSIAISSFAVGGVDHALVLEVENVSRVAVSAAHLHIIEYFAQGIVHDAFRCVGVQVCAHGALKALESSEVHRAQRISVSTLLNNTSVILQLVSLVAGIAYSSGTHVHAVRVSHDAGHVGIEVGSLRAFLTFVLVLPQCAVRVIVPIGIDHASVIVHNVSAVAFKADTGGADVLAVGVSLDAGGVGGVEVGSP